MATYTADDEDVKAMDDHDRVDYEAFLINYDVDANAETAQGKDTIRLIRDTVQGKFKYQPIQNLYSLYTIIYALLISLAFILMVIILIVLIILAIICAVPKWASPLNKLRRNMMLYVLFFFFGMLLLIYIITKFKDTAQTNLEKIIYVL
jgi:hypothetical protein